MPTHNFVGTWTLQSLEMATADNAIERPFGNNPAGYLIYDSSGNMAVQLMNPDRQRFASDDKFGATAEELRQAFTTFEGYFGTYEVRENERIVIHRVIGALFPNWSGTEQRRNFEFRGDQLILSTGLASYNGKPVTARLVWQRVDTPR